VDVTTGIAATDAPPVLRARALVKRFGKVEVLRGLDMTVREGDVYGFLGRNGSGKTTTLRACMGIVTTTSGELEILGTVVKRPTVAQKREIGYVSQEQHFYPWMRCDGLGRFVGAFYPSWDAAEFARLLRALDVPPDRKVAQLSGGMRAKLGLALALAHRPRLLLLDEPTAGLDPAARREFLEIVRLQAREGGHTTVFSSHIVEEVERVADRIGILDQGRLVYEGDLPTLRATVRRLDLAPPAPAQPGEAPAVVAAPGAPFETLSEFDEGGRRSLVLRAPPAAWDAEPLPPGVVTTMTLEDIFLALAVGRLFRA
jgi:ABC-2 type transport system ATP-binding protein